MKNVLLIGSILLCATSFAFGLTEQQKQAVKTYAQTNGIRNLTELRDRLNTPPRTGTTTNTVNVAREQWEKQLINGFKTVCQNAGIVRADLDDAGTVRTKLATWANGLTAANREAAQVNIIPLFWIAYDRFRSQDPATIDADNVSYQVLQPTYGTAPRVSLGLPELTNDDVESALK